MNNIKIGLLFMAAVIVLHFTAVFFKTECQAAELSDDEHKIKIELVQEEKNVLIYSIDDVLYAVTKSGGICPLYRPGGAIKTK